jgi:hypothetical protein
MRQLTFWNSRDNDNASRAARARPLDPCQRQLRSYGLWWRRLSSPQEGPSRQPLGRSGLRRRNVARARPRARPRGARDRPQAPQGARPAEVAVERTVPEHGPAPAACSRCGGHPTWESLVDTDEEHWLAVCSLGSFRGEALPRRQPTGLRSRLPAAISVPTGLPAGIPRHTPRHPAGIRPATFPLNPRFLAAQLPLVARTRRPRLVFATGRVHRRAGAFASVVGVPPIELRHVLPAHVALSP